MSKKLNEDIMASELSGSAFFRPQPTDSPTPPTETVKASEPAIKRATTPKPVRKPAVIQEPKPVPAREAVQPAVLPPVPTYARTPGRRTITRYAFEFFQDQIETLKRISLEQQFAGEKGSMSEMVREALDAYLARRLNQLNGCPDGE